MQVLFVYGILYLKYNLQFKMGYEKFTKYIMINILYVFFVGIKYKYLK